MKSFKFEVTMKVADCWIEDGFGAHSKKDQKRLELQIVDALKENLLTSSYEHEFVVTVKTISHPPLAVVAKLQGY